MKKIRDWVSNQSKKSKTILLIGFISNLIYSIYVVPFFLPFNLYSARVLGTLIAQLSVVLFFAAPIALIMYLICRHMNGWSKNYFDYFCITFLAFSLIFIYMYINTARMRQIYGL